MRLRMLLLVATCWFTGAWGNVWWDPAFSGEGWTFHIQDGVLFGTYYTYDDDGNPSFFTTSGPVEYSVVSEDHAFGVTPIIDYDSTLVRTRNRRFSTNVGRIQIQFRNNPSTSMASVAGPGFVRRLVPFVYGYGSQLDLFSGVWSFTFFNDDLTSNARSFVFNGVVDLVDLLPAAIGVQPGAAENAAVAFDDELQYYLMTGNLAEPAFGVSRVSALIRAPILEEVPTTGIWMEVDAAGNPVSEPQPMIVNQLLPQGLADALFDPFSSKSEPLPAEMADHAARLEALRRYAQAKTTAQE